MDGSKILTWIINQNNKNLIYIFPQKFTYPFKNEQKPKKIIAKALIIKNEDSNKERVEDNKIVHNAKINWIDTKDIGGNGYRNDRKAKWDNLAKLDLTVIFIYVTTKLEMLVVRILAKLNW